jgi:putative phosphoribosyl transferase
MAASTKKTERDVEIESGPRELTGILRVPPAAKGVVAFAHGSGSGRFSPRNQFVARVLQEAELATLLLDLLEKEEAEDRQKVFDIELLAERLQSATYWLNEELETRALRVAYFGASTGAAAALVPAARNPVAVSAVVSRGGRPDLARDYLSAVEAPTLLIVGGNDDMVIRLSEQALRLLRCPKQLVIVPGATHLFEEPGTLEEVARLAKDWFLRYLDPVHNLSRPSHARGSGRRRKRLAWKRSLGGRQPCFVIAKTPPVNWRTG